VSGERIEYRRCRAAPLTCGCPRVVHRVDRPDCLLVVWHQAGCTQALESIVPPPPRARLAPGAVPCPRPRCGNVVFSWAAGGPPTRRCDGPAGCGHVWTPSGAAEAAGGGAQHAIGVPVLSGVVSR
jgi:hypothetical protein